MVDKIMIKPIKLITISNYYFFFAIWSYFFMLLNSGFRPGVFMASLLTILALVVCKRVGHVTAIDVVVFIYIIYNLISYIWNNVDGFSFWNYLEEVSVSVLPIVLFYIAPMLDYKKTTSILINSTVFCIILGIFLYIWMPDFYREYLYKMGFAASSNIAHCRQGMSSFIGRIQLGTFAVVSAAFCKEQYERTYRWMDLIKFMLLIAGSILSAQRASWIGGAVLFFLFIFQKINKEKAIQVISFAPLLIILTFSFFGTSISQYSQVLEKMGRFSNAIAERSSTWVSLFEHTDNLVFGNGIGTVGHRAVGISKYIVSDGNYSKIIGEIGFLGLALFFFAVILVFLRLWKTKYKSAVFVVLFMLFQAVGSNVLALQITAPLFWYSLGLYRRSNNENYSFISSTVS